MSYVRPLFTPRHEAGGELYLGEERVRRSDRQGKRRSWYCDQCGSLMRAATPCRTCTRLTPDFHVNLYRPEGA